MPSDWDIVGERPKTEWDVIGAEPASPPVPGMERLGGTPPPTAAPAMVPKGRGPFLFRAEQNSPDLPKNVPNPMEYDPGPTLRGAREIARGVKQAVSPAPGTSRWKGATQIVTGAGDVLSPGIPGAVEGAAARTAAEFGAGYLAGQAAPPLIEKAGGSPELAEFGGAVAGVLPFGAAARRVIRRPGAPAEIPAPEPVEASAPAPPQEIAAPEPIDAGPVPKGVAHPAKESAAVLAREFPPSTKSAKASAKVFEAAEPRPEWEVVKQEPAAPAKHEFASTQVNLPDEVAARVRGEAVRIPESDLAPDGRENEPHVTVKYGLHGDDAEAVRKVLADEPPVRVRLGKTSLFSNDDADVVKVDVDSQDLHRLNKKIADALPHTDTHPDYKPHVTLAYVKPGEGAKYAGNGALEGQEITIDHVVFSDKNGNKTAIPLGQSAAAEPPPSGVARLKTADIAVNPSRFQFKMNVGQGGAGEELRGVPTWDEDLAGVIAVWRDPVDGKTYVVNGHHRLDLAKRLGVEDINARYVTAKTAQQARLKGALINIAEGRGTALDAAKVFRESGLTAEQLGEKGVSVKGAVARDGLALSRLSNPIFDQVVSGDLPMSRASIVGEYLPEHADQEAVLGLIRKAEESGKKVTNDEVRELIRRTANAPRVTETHQTLFGDENTTRNLAWEQAEISSYVRSRLGQEKRLFGLVSTKKAAERLGAAGNVIKAKENADVAGRASQTMAVYDKLSESAGPVSDALAQGAKELAAGAQPNEVKHRVYEAIHRAVADVLRTGGDRRPAGVAEPGTAPPGAGDGATVRPVVEQPAVEPEPQPAAAEPAAAEPPAGGSLNLISGDDAAAIERAQREQAAQIDAQRATQEINFGKGKPVDAGWQPIDESPLFGGPRQADMFAPQEGQQFEITRGEGERGSISNKPAQPETQPNGNLPPEEYQRLEKYQSLSPESMQQFKGMIDEEVTKLRGQDRGAYPLRPQTVGFEHVSELADALSDSVIAKQVQLKPAETMAPEVRLASERAIKRWMQEQRTLTDRLNSEGDKLAPADRDKIQGRIAQLDVDTRRVLDNLITARTQDGRNLAYHKIDLDLNGIDPVAIMGRLKRAHGGQVPDKVNAQARRMMAEAQAAPEGPARQAKMRDLAKFLAQQEQSGWIDTIASLRKAGLLTGIKTHARNLGGNTMFQAMEEVSRVPASIVDMAMSTFTNKRTVAGASVRANVNASYQAATKGVQQAVEIMRHGATQEQLAQLDIPRELNSKSKVINTYVNTVFRLMSAEDRVFKAYALRRSLEAQAKLQAINERRAGTLPPTDVIKRAQFLTNNPTETMAAQAVSDAEFATFNNRNIAATMVSTARNTAKTLPGGHVADFVADMVMPFVRTPTNVIARLFDYSLSAPIKVGINVARAVANKGVTPQQQHAISMAMGRGTVGAGLIYMGWKLSEAGLMTGTSPSDPGQRAVDEAAGRRPGSIRIGSQWHLVSPFSPAGNVLTIGATLQREATRELKDEAKRVGNIAAIATRSVLEQPMLQGMQDTVEALQDPEKRGERVISSQAGSFVPTIVSDVGSLTDSVRRDIKPESAVDALAKGVAARIPGIRNTLPEKRDVLGRPVEEHKTSAFVPTIPNPAKELTDPVIRELVNQGAMLGRPSRHKGESTEEYNSRAELAGRLVESAIREAIQDPRYGKLPEKKSGNDIRRLVINDAVSSARRELNEVVNDARYKGLGPKGRIALMRNLTDMVNKELVASAPTK